jgi:hypothetical protein
MDQLGYEPWAMANRSEHPPFHRKCILKSLMDRSTTALFATHANLYCHSAAGEQDEIR